MLLHFSIFFPHCCFVKISSLLSSFIHVCTQKHSCAVCVFSLFRLCLHVMWTYLWWTLLLTYIPIHMLMLMHIMIHALHGVKHSHLDLVLPFSTQGNAFNYPTIILIEKDLCIDPTKPYNWSKQNCQKLILFLLHKVIIDHVHHALGFIFLLKT